LTSIHEQILQIEERMRAQCTACHPDLRHALEYLISSGGKRIRPTVVLLIGNMLGAQPERLLNLGAAVEMLHTATLVHDDLIDGALFRRGVQTLNARWSPAATVLTGDFLFARAANLAAEVGHLAIMQLFAQTLAIIVNGELTQLFSARGLISRDNYYQRIYAKTASLFEMSAQAAAMISASGDDSKVVEACSRFGYELGIAFQIVDDVLDFVGDPTSVGKPLGSDLLQGLVTLPALYFAEANPNHPDVRLLAAGGWGDQERMQRLIQAIRTSESIPKTLREAEDHVEQAIDQLQLFADSESRRALESLARYVVDRRI